MKRLLVLLSALLLATLVSCGSAGNSPVIAATSPSQSYPAEPRILVIGDSTTWTIPAPMVGAEQLWPNILEDRLIASGINVRIENRGFSGGTVRDGIRRLDQGVYNLSFDTLIVSFGLNDAYDMAVPPEEFKALMRRFIALRDTRSPKASVVLLEPPVSDDPMRAPFLIYYRSALRQLGDEYADKQVYVVNLAEAYSLDDPGFVEPAGHRVHPNAYGHQHIADLLWLKLSTTALHY